MTTSTNNNRLHQIGWILSGLAILALLGDATVNIFFNEMLRETMEAEGFPAALAPAIGILSFTCAVVYAIPRTAVLGAILTTGFFGGAISIHFRLGEMGSPPQFISLAIAALAWGGLYLRDPRVRALMPLRARA